MNLCKTCKNKATLDNCLSLYFCNYSFELLRMSSRFGRMAESTPGS